MDMKRGRIAWYVPFIIIGIILKNMPNNYIDPLSAVVVAANHFSHEFRILFDFFAYVAVVIRA